MIDTIKEMYENLTEKITSNKKNTYSDLHHIQDIIDLTNAMLGSLKEKMKGYHFADDSTEITFYKELKPRFYAIHVFYVSIFHIETGKPFGTKKCQKKYLLNELKKIDDFFFQNPDFYRYYRSGQTHYDKEYFTRKWNINRFELFSPAIDNDFCTIYSLKVAIAIANEKLKVYVENELSKLNFQTTSKIEGENTNTSYKVKVNLSVDQIAIILRAAVDCKVIGNTSYNWLAGMLAPFISTVHKNDITVRSLRNKGSISAMEGNDLEVAKTVIMNIYKAICKY